MSDPKKIKPSAKPSIETGEVEKRLPSTFAERYASGSKKGPVNKDGSANRIRFLPRTEKDNPKTGRN